MVNLESFAGGALQEKFDNALQEILTNMTDPNTPWKNKREIMIKVTFEQNEERDDSNVHVSVATKTAAIKPISTKMAIAKDLETGKVFAEEYGKQIMGQMSIEDLEPEKPDVETENKVVDLRARQA